MITRILVADDHSAVRAGVRHILTQEYQQLEFGEAIDSLEVFRKLRECEWDVIILDVDLPGRNGLDILKQLRLEGFRLPVLIFSFHREEEFALRALKAGAAGYICKSSADTELIIAIKQVLSGKRFISPEVAELLASQLAEYTEEPHTLLSDREYQIVLLIAKGKTVTRISSELNLGVSTVSTYRARILDKMRMKNNAELMSYMLRQNLI